MLGTLKDGMENRIIKIAEESGRLAKQAAGAVAMSPQMRAELKTRFTQAKELAVFVGRLTFAAGNHRDSESSRRISTRTT